MAQKVEQQLKEFGSKLESPPSSKDALAKLLKQAAICLSELDQSPSASILESMQPFLSAIVKPELLQHHDRDVKLLVATCICEITRITAPEAPYDDDVLKDIFQLIVGTFSGLTDTGGPSFGRRVVILETLAKYRSCVVMLDLECDDLVNKMFSTFFAVASDDHPENVLTSMQKIMEVLLEESEDIHEDLLLIVLSMLGRNKKDATAAARKLAMNVIESCSVKLEPMIKQFLVSSMSGEEKPSNDEIDYHEVIYDVYNCAPQILSAVIPYLTGELLTDHLDTRLKAVRLVGDLFSLPGRSISEAFQPIFSEFLKRLTDRAVEIRLCVLEHVKNCLLSDSSRPEAPQIISALCDRLLDYDENVRKQVVVVISDVACQSLNSIPVETVKLISDRLRDKSPLVKKYTMERLADIFRVHWVESEESAGCERFDWIPGKILRCFYDKDFRSDTIESVLCGSLFASEVPMKDKARCWVRFLSGFDKVETKALERILEQKQRLQQEMQRYLSLRQMYQNGDAPDIQKKVQFCFRIMSRFFADPGKAEENFQILDQLKDANIWKILVSVLDPNTSYHQSSVCRDDLLQILGEKHRLYDFLGTLSVKCSYLLLNKEHVKEILLETSVQKSAGNSQYTQSCMDILVILARYIPSLLIGSEEELVKFLKDDNDIIKEGALHILARAGAIIREQLATSSSSVDLILERLCLEGSRRQAKYAVHALGAITKDDGLKSLSVLYKRLVDMLEEKSHLPAVLQSLGCIAQTAMPVFETRESEIEEFIKTKILSCSNKADDNAAGWDDRSELCLLKIYGIKTLVKSYLPVKDAHLRPGIDSLLAILKNILSFGEIAEDVDSSSVDKAHMKLASAKAILRLSKYWDHKIPIDLFHLTLRTLEIGFPQARKLLLGKIHQYIKDRLLDVKYASAFLFGTFGSNAAEFEEEKQNLADILQIQSQAKARQQSTQSDANNPAYPDYILSHLVHALAHQSCPDIDEHKNVDAFELTYRQLYIILSVLLHGDEDGKSESNSRKEQETTSAIVSVFESIQRSEDAIEAAKTKKSHAICDLGLSIIKRLTKTDVSMQEPVASASLPPTLYRLYECTEGDNSKAHERKTWLADESILVHFESLKLEIDRTSLHQVPPENVEDVDKDEKEGSELPLKKMIKQLKPPGTKSRKAAKSKSVLPEKVENDIDVLKMVREINLDSKGISTKFDSSNGHEHPPLKGKKVSLMQQNGEKSEANDPNLGSIPKRRRSLSAQSPSKIPKNDKALLHKRLAETPDSELLVSCINKNKSSSSKKRKSLDKGGMEEAHEVGEVLDDDIKMETDDVDNSPVKSPTGTSKKQKRKSIAGLAKCTTKEVDNLEDLIGCKIKVWWPMDKQFYQGTIKSYDSSRRKHVILYDDGDVEILNLEKERWELIDKGQKASKFKKSKSSKTPVTKRVSPEQKNKISGGSQGTEDSFKMVKGKRTPKKRKPAQRGFSEADIDETEDRGVSDISEAEPSTTSKDEDMKGDYEGGTDTEGIEGHAHKEVSKKRVQSKGRGKAVKGKKRMFDDVDSSDKEQDPNVVESPTQDAHRSDQEHDQNDVGSPLEDIPQKEVSKKRVQSKGRKKAVKGKMRKFDAADASNNEQDPNVEESPTQDAHRSDQEHDQNDVGSPMEDIPLNADEQYNADRPMCDAEKSSKASEDAEEAERRGSNLQSETNTKVRDKNSKGDPSVAGETEIPDDEPLNMWVGKAGSKRLG